jgi:hypothetical protein
VPNPRKQLGTALENRVVAKAKEKGLRARRQPLSGVLKDFPNDVEIERLLGECKVRTTKLDAKGAKILSIDLDWLDGVRANAARMGYESAAVFVRPKGSERILAMLDLDTLYDLLRAATQ